MFIALLASPLLYMCLFLFFKKPGLYIEKDKLVFKRFLRKQLDVNDENVGVKLNKTQTKLVELLKNNPNITIEEMAKKRTLNSNVHIRFDHTDFRALSSSFYQPIVIAKK